ncbi:MAG TPA: FAD-binding oxidoreductase [Candidatus Xenobia bacterium]|jgi:alkyldihydroxyacetonephosphate synthase
MTDFSVFSRGAEGRIVPPPPPAPRFEDELPDRWGYGDTRLFLNDRGNIEVTGNRYPISGHELPDFLPWMEGQLSHRIDPQDPCLSHYPPSIPGARSCPAFMADIQKVFPADGLSTDAKVRLRHGHGHTQYEIYSIKHGSLPRVPDLVAWPTEEEHVVALVEAAKRHDVCVIPFGGGTSVSQALLCPKDESRPIVSVDMRRMNRILWIDPVSRMACIQAGAVGGHIAKALQPYGLTMGHEPDSIEFSTLGGWIATHASGMKKNRYGNIEDIVLDMRVVTANGMLERTSVHPRESVGCDPRLFMFGSEGSMGIVTSAVVKLTKLPEVQKYGSLLFHDFDNGVAFMYDLSQCAVYPASVRLMDNVQFQFGAALKPRPAGGPSLKSKLEKAIVLGPLGFDKDKMVACTMVFEGTAEEVRSQEAEVYRRAKKYGGFKAGEENGRRGYMMTYCIAYIRDLAMDNYILAESFETSVPWSQVLALCSNVKQRLREEHKKHNLPGTPFLSCRVTQIYETGVCVYFYYAFHFKGVENPSQVYSEIEDAAREEVLKQGGSLSHHHGVGKLRQRFLPEVKSQVALDFVERTRETLDPSRIFGCRNQAAVPEPAHSP